MQLSITRECDLHKRRRKILRKMEGVEKEMSENEGELYKKILERGLITRVDKKTAMLLSALTKLDVKEVLDEANQSFPLTEIKWTISSKMTKKQYKELYELFAQKIGEIIVWKNRWFGGAETK